MTAAISTAAMAARAGVHRDTLLRWLREGRIPEPKRDRNRWRRFTEDEAKAIERFAHEAEETHTVSLDGSTLHRLKSVDWDFVNAKTSYLTHHLHPYPAKFIPQIPNALIQELSTVGETVLDIFCGSGTSLVESLLLKRHAIGIDANPLACLVSKAKTTRLNTREAEALIQVMERAARFAEQSIDPASCLFPQAQFLPTKSPPDDDAIKFWFEPSVVEELTEIRSWCHALPTQRARTVALAAFSAIIVTVSKQDSDTRYVRREKRIRPGDAFRRFGRSLSEGIRACTELADLVEPRFRCKVTHSDVLKGPNVGPVDLVVCSPPYPNAYSYHLYHMTRMIWLGYDHQSFKQREIGSHRKYSSKKADVSTFRDEMSTVFAWLQRHLRRGRHACFVVGDSILQGKRIDNAAILSEAAAAKGFVEVARIERQLQDGKKSFNPSIGKIKREKILILELVRGGCP